MDIEFDWGHGIEVTTAIRREQPDARVVILTAFDHDERVLRAVHAGARGYLLMGTPRE